MCATGWWGVGLGGETRRQKKKETEHSSIPSAGKGRVVLAELPADCSSGDPFFQQYTMALGDKKFL